MSKGFLLVIDGIDGSGKTTQIEFLKKYLSGKNISHEVISFPQYGKNEYSKKIKDYLEGKLGNIWEVDPYFIAKAYAADRLAAKDLINSWLNDGKLVIANRYVSASKAHLGANLPDGKRAEFIKWLDELEYQTNKMPKEDLTILLNVDPKVGQQNARNSDGSDIHEEDLKHLQEANKIFLELSKKDNWMVVNCMENGLPAGKQGQMKPQEDIHKDLLNLLKGKIF